MQKVKAWQTTDGKTFNTLAEAQKAELVSILGELSGASQPERESYASHLIANAEKVVNVLTLKDSSHPKARKAATAPAKQGKKKGVAELPQAAAAPAE